MSPYALAIGGHWRASRVATMTNIMKSDEQALGQALVHEFGRPFELARLDVDAHFVYDHACRIGE